MHQTRQFLDWNRYLATVVAGLRVGESANMLADHVNAEHGTHLTKNNIVSAMRSAEQDLRMTQDGPLIRLLRQTYPKEARELIERYRNRHGGQSKETQSTEKVKLLPRWKRQLTPEQLAVFNEIAAEPKPVMTFRCPVLVYHERTEELLPCGKLSLEPCCKKHRVLGKQLKIDDLSNRIRRVA